MEFLAGRIVVPFSPSKLRPETAQWAAENDGRLRDVSSDPAAYFRALCEWWAAPGNLLVVEHDMLPADGVAEEMLACPEPWCSSPYPLAPMVLAHMAVNGFYLTVDGVASEVLDEGSDYSQALCTDALGCTKFSAELKERLPNLVVESGTAGGVPGEWQLNDVRISGLLRKAGLAPHLHSPSAHLSVS